MGGKSLRRLSVVPAMLLGAWAWVGCEDLSVPAVPFVGFDASVAEGGNPPRDGAVAPDAGTAPAPVDAGRRDAAGTDAGPADAASDAGPDEAGTDAGTSDAAVDAGPPNAIRVSKTSGLTAEDGSGFTFAVTLDRGPTADVTVALTVSRPAEASLSVPSITFTPGGPLQATVEVLGLDDGVADADQAFTVTVGAPSTTDPTFAGQGALVVDAVNRGWVQLLKNVAFEIAPGVSIDLDDPGAFPAAYVADGGWVGAPNAPFNTIIADGHGVGGTRGARLTRPVGTDGTHLPSFQQEIPVPPPERTCLYRARAAVLSEDATARLRLHLNFDTNAGAHVGGSAYADGTAAVNTWETLQIVQAGSAAAYDKIVVQLGPTVAEYTGAARADDVRLDRICK